MCNSVIPESLKQLIHQQCASHSIAHVCDVAVILCGRLMRHAWHVEYAAD